MSTWYTRDNDAWPFAIAIVVTILVAMWLLVAPPLSDDTFCDTCPEGSRARLVKDMFGWPTCICEVAR